MMLDQMWPQKILFMGHACTDTSNQCAGALRYTALLISTL